MHHARSLAAMPIAIITAERVTNCNAFGCDYCSIVLRERSRSLGHVPLIDHNPSEGEKIEFTVSEARCYRKRIQAARINARLMDDYGGRFVRGRGNNKVMAHLMFGRMALTAEQLMWLLM